MRRSLLGISLLALSHAAAEPGPPAFVPAAFTSRWNVGFGSAVFVTGNQAALGQWAPGKAVKLAWGKGNTWSGTVALPAGCALEYKFIRRSLAADDFCDGRNVEWTPGANLTRTLPGAPAATGRGKTVYYYSAWTNAVLNYAVGGGRFTRAAMECVGPAPGTNGFLYRRALPGRPGANLEFTLTDGAGRFDLAPYSSPGGHTYQTTLDRFLVRDGNLFNYWPADTLSAPRVISAPIASTTPGIAGRAARIYLPRGYDEQTWKRYPVLYMQDGQNIFASGGTLGSWDADRTATREISQGRMRECIIVGLDNTPARRAEYEPPGDVYHPGEPPGCGDAYVRFLTADAKSAVDADFRTLPDPRHTFIGGSSMGGLISIYAGFESRVFGGVLAMSPSITRAPNYERTLAGRAKGPGRIYLDTGSAEGPIGPGVSDYWYKPWAVYDLFLAMGYAAEGEFIMRVGCNQAHHESAWATRLPEALRFLLDPRDETNCL